MYSKSLPSVYKVHVTSYLSLILLKNSFHRKKLYISQTPTPAFRSLSLFITLSFEKWMLLDVTVVSFQTFTVLPPSYFMSSIFSHIVVCPYFYSFLCFFPYFFYFLICFSSDIFLNILSCFLSLLLFSLWSFFYLNALYP